MTVVPFDPDEIARSYGEEPPPDGDVPRLGGLGATSAADFLAEDIAEPKWLTDEILPEGAIGFIGGAPKVLKSWLALDLAAAVAAGGLFCGRFLCPEPRRVLLTQFESGRAHYQKRVRQVLSRYDVTPEGLYIVSNEPIVLEDPVSVQRVSVELADKRPDLWVIDPLASVTTGDENSAQEMGRVVRQLRAWRDEFGCAIAIVHHTNKAASGVGSGMRSGLKLRGSNALYGATEWALWVDRPDESVPRVEVRVEQKEAEPRKPFAVAFDDATGGITVVSDTISVQVTDDELVDAIVARKRRATARELSGDLGVEERTVRERMAYLTSPKMRRAYIEEGSGKGRKPLVYVVPRGLESAVRITSAKPSQPVAGTLSTKAFSPPATDLRGA